jgi:hypothetical protein
MAFRPWNKSPSKERALASGRALTVVIFPITAPDANVKCVPELAPQEIRTFFITAVAANRRRGEPGL